MYINNMSSRGVRKSNKDVVNGIKKLFGSFPRLNKNMELENKSMKTIPKRINNVNMMTAIINSGFII